MQPIDLKLERVRRGVRQYRLAAELGIPPTTLSKIENGQRRVSPDRLIAIVAKLDEIAPARAGGTPHGGGCHDAA